MQVHAGARGKRSITPEPGRSKTAALRRELASDAAANSRQSAGRRAVAPRVRHAGAQRRTPALTLPLIAAVDAHTRDRRRECARPTAIDPEAGRGAARRATAAHDEVTRLGVSAGADSVAT